MNSDWDEINETEEEETKSNHKKLFSLLRRFLRRFGVLKNLFIPLAEIYVFVYGSMCLAESLCPPNREVIES